LFSELEKRVRTTTEKQKLKNLWHTFDRESFVHVHGLAKHFNPAGGGFYGGGVADITKYYFEDKYTKDSLNTVVSISEAKPDSSSYEQARKWIEECERCVILGFGFAESNIANLRFFDVARGKSIFASATGMPRAHIANLKQRFEAIGARVTFGEPSEDALQFMNNHCWLD
jgi:hypothetical protein